MKKSISIIVALIAFVGSVFAQNQLKVESPVEVAQGGAANLVINFEFESEGVFAGYSFDIVLPEGISMSTDTYTAGGCHVDHGFTINYRESEKYYSLACISLTSELLKGKSGMLLALPIQADESIEVGTTLSAKIQNINFGMGGGSLVTFDNDVDFDIVITNEWVLDEKSVVAPVASGKKVNNVKV